MLYLHIWNHHKHLRSQKPRRRAGYIFARPAAERTGVGRDLAYFTPSLGGMLQQALQTPNSPLTFCLTQLQLVLAPVAWLFGLSEPKNRA
jgi:hypothetical protein